MNKSYIQSRFFIDEANPSAKNCRCGFFSCLQSSAAAFPTRADGFGDGRTPLLGLFLQPNAELRRGQLSGGGRPYYGETCQTQTLGWHHRLGSGPLPARAAAPVPAFSKCPIWQEPCPAVSLKVLVQIPPSNVKPGQILNGPNDAFQIVSSHITFREKRGLCFINSTGGRWRKPKSRTCCLLFLVCSALGRVFVR